MRGLISTTLALALAGTAAAQGSNPVPISTPIPNTITTPFTATNDQLWQFTGTVRVKAGASITFEAGTVVANSTFAGQSIIVERGAQIFVNGTDTDPVIFTSRDDVLTWEDDLAHPSNRDPKTGIWRESALEWGSIAVLGSAFISEDGVLSNVATPNAGNFANIEGVAADPTTRYGGGDDDDDSGNLNYLSLRYGGRVLELQSELNGISLGGVGRETDVNFLEVMNNVDDGIEIFGGTVNIKHFNVWNIGDDSFDVDQGWRGCAQFGLVVQGHSLDNADASQGSGLGDNAFEMDGAEDSFWQPVTTAQIANVTVIGNSVAGDDLTAWRDNARVQFRNCTFLEAGLEIVDNDGDDGDGAQGYGAMGTLSFEQTLMTPALTMSGVPNVSPVNLGTETDPGTARSELYQAQSEGNLSGFYNCAFFKGGAQLGSVLTPDSEKQLLAIEETDFVNDPMTPAGADSILLNPAFNNEFTVNNADLPVLSLTRTTEALINGVGGQTSRITSLNPGAAGAALLDNSNAASPEGGPMAISETACNGFFTATGYRGGFGPGDSNWLGNWTASYAFGFSEFNGALDLGFALGGTDFMTGTPVPAPTLALNGQFTAGNPPVSVQITGAANTPALLILSLGRADLPFAGGTIVPDFVGATPFGGINFQSNLTTNSSGVANSNITTWPAIFDTLGTALDGWYIQAVTVNPRGGILFSNAHHIVGA